MLRAGDGAPRGSVSLWRAPAGLLLRVEASGLPPGWHGFHIHAVGRCEDASFQSAGPHAGHGGGAHGLLNVAGPENGDLVNLFADASGRVRAEVFTGLVSLDGQNARPAIMDGDGAAFVIHASADDHTSQPIGGAGPRIACGVVTKG
jgi:Cu-Zn family superoxide dismutase